MKHTDRKPKHLRPAPGTARTRHRVKAMLREAGLHTVCESARCPNLGECFHAGTAVFLILGDICTRNCAFCAVKKGKPSPPDPLEAGRVAQASKKLGLKHVVVTSVTRDDLEDGGSSLFVATAKELRSIMPKSTVELLVPDFAGSVESLEKVIAVRPDVFNHNVETVPRLYDEIRPGADWNRSLDVLKTSAAAGLVTKSGMMLGMGETPSEIKRALEEIHSTGCKMITLGQYLAPGRGHRPVARYLDPDEFEKWRETGVEMGFDRVFSGPLVRSSYHAAPLE